MTLLMRELERVDSRVLGALRCVDAVTRVAVDSPLQVDVAGATLRRSRSGLHVITQVLAPLELAAHEAAFDAPPATPSIGSVALTARITDPSGRYLARLAALALPRDPLAANAATPGSLFRPIDIALFPASVAPVGVNWAVLRVSLRHDGSGDALGGALLLVESGGTVLARGMSDWRGEALVGIPGVPVTTWSDAPGAVVVTEIAAQLVAVFDPARGSRVSAADVRNGIAPSTLPSIDPDALEAQRGTLPNASQAVSLATGRSQSVSFALALP